MSRVVRHWRDLLCIILPLSLFNALLLPYIHHFPVWDALWFFECVTSAAAHQFREGLLCVGHPSFVYTFSFALPQFFANYNVEMLNIMTLILGNVALVAFYFICRKLFSGKHPFVVMSATMLFASHPVIVSNVLHFNLDTGVAVMTLLCLCFVLYKQIEWAVLAGIILVFTKEPGILCFTLLVGFYLLLHVTRPAGPMKAKLRNLCSHWQMFLPIGVFIFYTVYQSYVWKSTPFWGGSMHGNLVSNFLQFKLLDQGFLLSFANVFILNFQWIGAAFILVAFIVYVGRYVFNMYPTHHIRFPAHFAHDGHQGSDKVRDGQLIVGLMVGAGYLLTRFIPFNNVRYILILYPLYLLVFALSLEYLFKKANIIIGIISLVCVTQLLAMYTSVDPVSRLIYTSIPFGKHSLYLMSRFDGCCGYGRDQLVYNLAFARLSSIQDEIYAYIRPSADTPIVSNGYVWKGFAEPLDSLTFKRTLQSPKIFPRYMSVDSVVHSPDMPSSLYFIQYPNFDNTYDVAMLEEHYVVVERKEFGSFGFTIPVLHFQKR